MAAPIFQQQNQQQQQQQQQQPPQLFSHLRCTLLVKRPFTGIGHGECSDTGVLKLEVLVGEFPAVDAFASAAVAVSHVTALAHETGNDSVKGRVAIPETRLTYPVSTNAKMEEGEEGEEEDK